jgi:hypothetical protein
LDSKDERAFMKNEVPQSSGTIMDASLMDINDVKEQASNR